MLSLGLFSSFVSYFSAQSEGTYRSILRTKLHFGVLVTFTAIQCAPALFPHFLDIFCSETSSSTEDLS